SARRHQRTWLLYQGSIGSPVADFLVRREEPKLVYFHNITPRELVEPWDPGVGQFATAGWLQLSRLAAQVVAGLSPSRYNADQLAGAGVARTMVAPLLVDLEALRADVDEAALGRLRAAKTGADLLFVGKLSPHKAQHLLVQALVCYRRAYDPGARLHLVGGTSSRRYAEALSRYVADLGLEDAVEVAGSVTPGELAAQYANADVFVCASGHEGFCVPLLEAMSHAVPIVAYGVAAVPETLGDAGVVLSSRAPTTLASAVDRVLTDDVLRAGLAEGARTRLAALCLPRARAAMATVLEEAVGGG
ncbi:MAG TPA: glycosyltransferase, partial [Acidimicrobiales bacterium]|nr:glycosyltransferase [Acidimicrobiales bacterium]